MFLAVIHFCVIFGATFGWTGGAFLRYVWFFGLVLAACLVRKGRFGAAGALLALGALLRVFPAFFLVGPGLQAAWALYRREGLRPEHRRLFAAFSVTCALLFSATLTLPQGLRSWSLFRTNIKKHMETVAPNIIGLTPALAHRSADALVPPEEGLKRNEARQKAVYRVQLLTIAPLAFLLVVFASRQASDVEALALAAPLLLASLNLAAYYWVLLVAVALAFHDKPLRLLALFGLEIATHTLFLFEGAEANLYMERSVLLAILLVVLWTPGGAGERPATDVGDK
jgi:hypothetical protein